MAIVSRHAIETHRPRVRAMKRRSASPATDDGTIVLHRIVPASAVALRQVRRNMKGRHGKVDLAVLGAMMKDRWDKPFALASIPIDALNFQDIADSGEERIARAERYARMDTPLPPALASYRGGRRNAPRAYVTDGNHRVLAATLRGNRTALVYIPVDDLHRLRDDAMRIGLVTGMVVEPKAARSPILRSRGAIQNPAPSGQSLTAPASVRRMLRRGLALVAAGRAGKGLRGETTAWARDLADGLPVTLAKARKMRAWFARHGAAKLESARRMRDPESPAAVAWLLWGGDPSVAYRKTAWRDPVAAWLRKVIAPVRNPKRWAKVLPWMVLIPLVPPL